MVETRFEEMKRYVRFDDDDAHALVAFRPLAAPHFTRIAREFYERIREHEAAHAVFTGEEQMIERLRRSQVRWMHRLLSGTYDEAYLQETRTIGRVHVRVGLPQHYMFTAMALIRVALEAGAEAELGAAAPKARLALTQPLDLELAIMVESYREDLAEQARRRDELEAGAIRTDRARVREGRFREDLYYRLNVVQVDMPPLRLRGSDALVLANTFLRRFAEDNKKPVEELSEDARTKILAHRWPGNVRELENAIERTVVLCEGSRLESDDLPFEAAQPMRGPVRVPGATMAEIERWAILATLEATSGSTAKAAELLDISVRTIQYWLHEYGITGKERSGG